MRVPITVHPAAPEITGWSGAALIRPDGVLAWKTTDPAAVGELDGVLRGLLSLEPEG